MELGLHVCDFTWDGGPPALANDLRDVAAAAEQAGFARLSVMDHVWQIAAMGPPEHEMLEAYTTLGYLAAHTSRVQLLAWVTAAVYREPGLLAKCVTTLDVLSQGRACLGIGAAWNGEEARGLGLSFPPLAERYERLEETLRICLQMWSDSEQPFDGRHYHLARTLNSPQTLQRPHPPILIGGGGERKTLRTVAKWADGWNVPFVSPDEFARKRQVLHRHCEEVGRDPAEIRCAVNVALAWKDEDLVAQFNGLAEFFRDAALTGTDEEARDKVGRYVEAGADQVNIALRAPWQPEGLERAAAAIGVRQQGKIRA
jgi:F420-dependent oxidoreductase-like protein